MSNLTNMSAERMTYDDVLDVLVLSKILEEYVEEKALFKHWRLQN